MVLYDPKNIKYLKEKVWWPMCSSGEVCFHRKGMVYLQKNHIHSSWEAALQNPF